MRIDLKGSTKTIKTSLKAVTTFELSFIAAAFAILIAVLCRIAFAEGTRPMSALLLPKELKLSTSAPAQSDPVLTLKLAGFACEFSRLLPEDNVPLDPRLITYKFLHCYKLGGKTIIPKRPGELIFSEDPISIEMGNKELELPLSLFQGQVK